MITVYTLLSSTRFKRFIHVQLFYYKLNESHGLYKALTSLRESLINIQDASQEGIQCPVKLESVRISLIFSSSTCPPLVEVYQTIIKSQIPIILALYHDC